NPIYVRHYPAGELYGHPVGYSYVQTTQSELERSENDALVGNTNEFSSILDQLRGHAQVGDNVTLTLDSTVQKAALDALNAANASTAGSNGAGAVVAIDPRTGAIKAMVSTPGYDPNAVANTATFDKLQKPGSGSPLLNRATQSTYPPGSTMKVVTAAAALDSGKFTPTTTLTANSPLTVSGAPLVNDGDQSFGSIDMTYALTNSVNTYFAQVGEQVGPTTMVDYMRNFGFYSDPQLDYPSDEMAPTGPYNSSGHLVTSGFDVGRVAIGQGGAEGQMLATPMQMAEVAATIANGGTLERPSLVQKVTDVDGRTVSELKPSPESQAIKPQTATQLTDMMLKVTQEGTAAGLTVGGEPFAGKTGTAEIDVAAGINQPWFIGFAPASDPKIAVAATIERCTGCFGGSVAGPIATKVMDAALGIGG
ncbi:MAG: penicillin-binding protein, partial [Chloroflexota bacterium]|nr:penicillin-binding protein [Chloroflexota bacterium]